MRGNQVTEWGERAKKGAVEGKGGSESVRWERAAGWLCPGDNVQRTLGLRKLCPAKRASSPSSSSILQERDSTHQALIVREHWRHQGTGKAAHQQEADMCLRRSSAPASCCDCRAHPHAKEEERSLPQRPPRDHTVISVPCLCNISPTNPIYHWAFSFSHSFGPSPIPSSAFPSLEPLTS